MPLYDFKCDECGHSFEILKRMSDPSPKCPECAAKKVSQVYEKAPAYHNHFSPMHPRKNRGRGY